MGIGVRARMAAGGLGFDSSLCAVEVLDEIKGSRSELLRLALPVLMLAVLVLMIGLWF